MNILDKTKVLSSQKRKSIMAFTDFGKLFVSLLFVSCVAFTSPCIGSYADDFYGDGQGGSFQNLASCEAPSAAHHLEEAAAEIHNYLHDIGHSTGSQAHSFEDAAARIHNLLHDAVGGNATVEHAWHEFVLTLRRSGLTKGDSQLRRMFRRLRGDFVKIHLLIGCDWGFFQNSIIACRKISRLHTFAESAAKIHDYLHDYHNGAVAVGSAAHDLDDMANDLHDVVHDIDAAIPVLMETWYNFAEALMDSGLLDTDLKAKVLFDSVSHAFDELSVLLGDCT